MFEFLGQKLEGGTVELLDSYQRILQKRERAGTDGYLFSPPFDNRFASWFGRLYLLILGT
jgi:hypothetical protein